MSAMPERVFLRKENGDRGEETLLVSWLPVSGGGCVPYVPESALLAAEARVREVEAAFKKYGDHWDQCPAVTPRRKCNCGYDQARAILAREET